MWVGGGLQFLDMRLGTWGIIFRLSIFSGLSSSLIGLGGVAGLSSFAGLISGVVFASEAQAGELVKIRLKSDLARMQVSGLSLSFQSKEKLSPYQTVAIPRMQRAEIRSLQDSGRQLWKIDFPDSGSPSMQVFSDKLIVTGEMVRLDADPVPSRLYLYPRNRQRFDVIAQLDIESYLAGVLPSEMPVSWPLEALKAQVVASRSYMMSVMNERKSKPFHLEASVHDQVYKVINLIGADKQARQKIRKALGETRGQYLVGKKGSIYKAFYHADCGGQTEEPVNVWGIDVPNGTVTDPFCPRSPNARWTYELTKEDLKNALQVQIPELKDHNLQGLLVTQRTASGRIANMNVILEGKSPVALTAQEFRRIIGFHRLKSTNFSLQWFGDQLRIEGKGHGHGVGLCQWGSRHLASLGKDYRTILEHYYPKAKLSGEPNFIPTPEWMDKTLPDLLKVPQLSEKGQWEESTKGKGLAL